MRCNSLGRKSPYQACQEDIFSPFGSLPQRPLHRLPCEGGNEPELGEELLAEERRPRVARSGLRHVMQVEVGLKAVTVLR
jgi:hypothetical protein